MTDTTSGALPGLPAVCGSEVAGVMTKLGHGAGGGIAVFATQLARRGG